MPHNTNPAAKPAYDGATTHTVNPAVYRAEAKTSSPRRDTVSAHAPEGTSATNDTTDQMTSSDEICPTLRPWSANSRS
ncbi:hypothetical protein [Rhodococcus sp. ZPP]|uniref:hypothetical protein n=1 Tax=Rhodococcus sp. ZPP TaxID=2749906 RepID=UPI001AD886AE|nr:hypothetical protein [Rhodococcus sp. ZPP]